MATKSHKKIKTGKSNKGRKSKWSTHVEPFMERVKYWRRMGLYEKDICARLDVSEHTFNKFKNQYPQLVQALKESREDLDSKVVNALVRRALGFTYTEDIVIKDKVASVIKFVPPNTTAQIFYLKNRCPDLWKDVVDFRHRGKIETGQSVNITQIFEGAIKAKSEDDKTILAENIHAIYGKHVNRFKKMINDN